MIKMQIKWNLDFLIKWAIYNWNKVENETTSKISNELIKNFTCINWPFFECFFIAISFQPSYHSQDYLVNLIVIVTKKRWIAAFTRGLQNNKKLKELLAHGVVFIENKLACNNNKSEYLVCNVRLVSIHREREYLLLSSFDDEGLS